MKKLLILLGLALLALALNASMASAAKVRNGGFEHNLRGWKQNSDPGGKWRSLSGIPEELAAPKRGDRQAISIQDGPGARILTQKVKLRRKRRHRLSMWVQYDNQAPVWASPNTFDVGLAGINAASDDERPRGTPLPINQQIRIEVLKGKAPARATRPRQILATVLRTMPGDPLHAGWTRYRVNLSKFAGRKVKLRLAEVDTQNYLTVGVDAIKIKSKKKRRR